MCARADSKRVSTDSQLRPTMSVSDTRFGEDSGAKGQLKTKENELKRLQGQEELRQKCFDKSAESALKAQLQVQKEATSKTQQELVKVKANKGQIAYLLKREEDENERLKDQLEKERSTFFKVQEELTKVKELNAKLHASSCSKDEEIQHLTAENTRLQTDIDNKNQQLEEIRNEIHKLQAQLRGGGIWTSETQERVKITDVLLQLHDGQSKILAKLGQLSEQQRQTYNTYNGTESHVSLQKLPCKNQHCMQTSRNYQNRIDELTRQIFSEQCQRPECVKVRKEHRQQVVQSIGNANPAKDMEKQRLVEHDQLVREFETLTSDLDGLLGVLENTLVLENTPDNVDANFEANFEAKRLLCVLFQEAYDRSKEIVIRTISSKLESLFAIQKTKTEELEDASRGYGLLLHASSLRMEEIRAQYSEAIKAEMFRKVSSGGETFQKVKATLESSSQDHLGKAIELAWKFVTLPNPLIVCQPKKYNSHIHSPEHGYWDGKQNQASNLIYTRPVVYRNYEGVLACQGWVADKVSGKQ